MSREKKFKKKVRERAQRTGESYSIARMHLNGNESDSGTPPGPRTIRVSFVLDEFRESIAERQHALKYFGEGVVILHRPDESEIDEALDGLRELIESATPLVRQAAKELVKQIESTAREIRVDRASTFYELVEALEDSSGATEWLIAPDVELALPSSPDTRRSIIADLMPLMNESGQNEEAQRIALDILRGIRGAAPLPEIKAPPAHFAYPDGVLCKKATAIEKLSWPARPGLVIPHFALGDRLLVNVGFSFGGPAGDKNVYSVKVCEVIPEDHWVCDPGAWDSMYYGRQVRLKRNGPLHRLGREFALIPE